MEDRYLFRGKRTDNGEWVQGALFNGESHCIIGQEIKFSPYTEHECKIVGNEVDRDTICQYTGLKDKNGELIWENDVVRVTINSGSTICRCAFADTVAQFQLWQEHTIKRTSTVLNLGNYECEVIGNIFDNPELLKSEG